MQTSKIRTCIFTEGKHCKSEVLNCVSVIFYSYLPLRILILSYFARIHSYSLVVLFIFTLTHWFFTGMHSASLAFTLIHLCSPLFTLVLLVFTLLHLCSLFLTRVHSSSLVFCSCSLLFTLVLLVFTLIHSCSACSCSLVFYSCSLEFICVLLVFIGVHWPSLVFICVPIRVVF